MYAKRAGRNLLIIAAGILVAGCSPASTAKPTTLAAFVPPGYAACSTAVATMTLDRELDIKAIGDHPAYAATYRAAVNRWTVYLGQIAAVCSVVCSNTSIAMPTPAERLTAEDAFAGAIASHVADERAWPANAAWDGGWIDRYIALTRFYQGL